VFNLEYVAGYVAAIIIGRHQNFLLIIKTLDKRFGISDSVAMNLTNFVTHSILRKFWNTNFLSSNFLVETELVGRRERLNQPAPDFSDFGKIDRVLRPNLGSVPPRTTARIDWTSAPQ
jgi:hypothetical protein